MEQEHKKHPYSYRNLDVWKRAQDLALKVIRLTSGLPSSPAADVLVRQVIRSASSIAANMAEGHGRFSMGAFRNHLQIARGSACETDSWLDLMARAGLISEEAEADLHSECDIVIAALTSRVRALDRKMDGGSAVREAPVSYKSEFDYEPEG